MSAVFEKPQWLADFHAYLRARPVRRAAIWAVLSCVLMLVAEPLLGTPITARLIEITTAAFAVGGVLFYATMRWWETRHAG